MFNKGNEQKNCQTEKNGYLKVAFFSSYSPLYCLLQIVAILLGQE